MRIMLSACFLLTPLVVAAPVPKTLKRTPSLDGRWEIVEVRVGKLDVTTLNPQVWEIAGDDVTISRLDKNRMPQPIFQMKLIRPPGGPPNHIDYVYDSDGKEITLQCCFAADANSFSLSYRVNEGDNRPTSVDIEPGVTLNRFKRIRDK